MKLSGVVSDASLRFGSGENVKVYVNGRPVQDKIIRKAILEAYHRQITPGEYPFVVLMVEIDPKLVDVNVHPAKLQVKFANSKVVYDTVFGVISEALGEKRIANVIANGTLGSEATQWNTSKPHYHPNANLPSVEQLFSNDVPTAKVQSIF
jgi:DNA mismatch repair protein MutL